MADNEESTETTEQDVDSGTGGAEPQGTEGATETTPNAEDAAAAASAADGRPRPTREERQKDRKRVYQEREQYARENAELKARLAEVNRSLGGLNRNLEALRPAQEDPHVQRLKAFREKINTAIKRLGNDPSAMDEYHAAVEERERLNGQIAAAEEYDRREKGRAKPPNALQMRLIGEFPWLQTDQEAADATEATIHMLAKRRKANMDDPGTRYKICREAAALIARQHELEVVTMGGGDASRGADRVSGTSGKTSAPGGSTETSRQGANPEYVESLAIARFPNMPPQLAVHRWWKEIGNKMQG